LGGGDKVNYGPKKPHKVKGRLSNRNVQPGRWAQVSSLVAGSLFLKVILHGVTQGSVLPANPLKKIRGIHLNKT